MKNSQFNREEAQNVVAAVVELHAKRNGRAVSKYRTEQMIRAALSVAKGDAEPAQRIATLLDNMCAGVLADNPRDAEDVAETEARAAARKRDVWVSFGRDLDKYRPVSRHD